MLKCKMKSHGEVNVIQFDSCFLTRKFLDYENGEKFLLAAKYSKNVLRQILGDYVVLFVRNHVSLNYFLNFSGKENILN